MIPKKEKKMEPIYHTKSDMILAPSPHPTMSSLGEKVRSKS